MKPKATSITRAAAALRRLVCRFRRRRQQVQPTTRIGYGGLDPEKRRKFEEARRTIPSKMRWHIEATRESERITQDDLDVFVGEVPPPVVEPAAPSASDARQYEAWRQWEAADDGEGWTGFDQDMPHDEPPSVVEPSSRHSGGACGDIEP